jgi:hypothetical protein
MERKPALASLEIGHATTLAIFHKKYVDAIISLPRKLKTASGEPITDVISTFRSLAARFAHPYDGSSFIGDPVGARTATGFAPDRQAEGVGDDVVGIS